MKRRTRVVLSTLAAVGVVGVSVLAARAFAGDPSDEEGPPAVGVVRGDLVERALATGTIEPQVEVGVKSKVSGVVRAIFVEEGSFVRAGQPLMEIPPTPPRWSWWTPGASWSSTASRPPTPAATWSAPRRW